MRDLDAPLPVRHKTPVLQQVAPPKDAIPLYIQGMVVPLTEEEALGVIAQVASALVTRKFNVNIGGKDDR